MHFAEKFGRMERERMMENFWVELFVRGVVVCLLTALALSLLKRTAAAHRHLVCVLALCVLPLLPLMQRLMPPFRLLPPRSGAVAERATAPLWDADRLLGLNRKSAMPASHDTPQEAIPAAKFSPLLPATNRPDQTMAAISPAAHQEPAGNATAVLSAIWGVGAAALLIRLMVALLRLRRLERESTAAIVEGVPIRISAQATTPLTWGIRRSVILLPAAMLPGDPAVRSTAIRHEQAHIARWDWMWSLLAEVVCALCWFQPGAWWLRRRMRLESERACDDLVLLSGMAGPDYAAHLLLIVRSAVTHEVAPAMAQSGGMEKRMQHILDPKRPRRANRAWLAASAPFALALLSLAALHVSARPVGAQHVSTRLSSALQTRGSVMSSRLTKPASSTATPGTATMADMPLTALPAMFVDPSTSSALHSETTAIAPSRLNLPEPGIPEGRVSFESAIRLKDVQWSKAVDGLEPGFLLTTPAFLSNRHVPSNSRVTYRVLVRNITSQDRVFEFQCSNYGPSNSVPYLIPNGDLAAALSSRMLPVSFRAMGVADEAEVSPAYDVKLGPGEAIIVPEEFGLYLGDADKESYPRIESITAGMNWIVQPITIRRLTADEQVQAERSARTPYSEKKVLTAMDRNGRTRQMPVSLVGAQSGDMQLFARISIDIGTSDVKADRATNKVVSRKTVDAGTDPPAADGIFWGKKVNGFQLGARIVPPGSVFNVGDTIEFEAYGRNLTGHDVSLTVGNYWKVNYNIQVQTLDGKAIYMKRDMHNQRYQIEGYRQGPFGKDATQKIFRAVLGIAHALPTTLSAVETPEVEAVPLKPGHYRVRILSWGVFGTRKPEQVSAWIPIEVR